jgi:probable HAF family extracellular repeat protein
MTSLRYDTPNPVALGQSIYGPIRHHNTAAYAINNLGQIAGAIDDFGWTAPVLSGGIAQSAGYPSAAVRNPNGSIDFYRVSAPSNSLTPGTAFAINQAGDITGLRIPSGVDSSGYSTFFNNPFLGTGNNDLDQQVGYELGNYTTQLYTAGVTTTIANTLSATNYGFARDINNHGVVVGGAFNGPGNQAYRYTVAGGMVQLATKIGALDIYVSDALAINDNGWIVGTAVIPGFGNRAFLYTEADGMIDLNTVLSNSSNLTLLAATAISENGYIAGYGRSSIDGEEHAFLLAPPTAGNVPDKAATLPLFGLAMAGLLAARGRKPLAE